MAGEVYHVCSSSSGESVTSGSGTDGSFIEEMFEEDGHCEILLVPRREVSSGYYVYYSTHTNSTHTNLTPR